MPLKMMCGLLLVLHLLLLNVGQEVACSAQSTHDHEPQTVLNQTHDRNEHGTQETSTPSAEQEALSLQSISSAIQRPGQLQKYRPIQIQSFLKSDDTLNVQRAIMNPMPKPVNTYKHSYPPSVSIKKMESGLVPSDKNKTSGKDYDTEMDHSLKNDDKTEPFYVTISQDNQTFQYQGDTEEITTEGTESNVTLRITAETSTTNFASTLNKNTAFPSATTEPEHLQIPFCCFDGKENFCLKQYFQSNLLLPVALGHCQPPNLLRVSPIQQRNISCSLNNRMKIAMNNESKIVSTERELAFSFKSLFISEFCVEGDFKRANQWWVVICSLDSGQPEEKYCQKGKCLRKCCPEGYVLQNSTCICYEGKSLYPDIAFHARTDKDNNSQQQYGYRYTKFGIPECQHSTVKKIGHILNENTGNPDSYRNIMAQEESSEFSAFHCVEEALDDEDNTTYMIEMSCHEPQEGVWKTLRKVLIPAGLVVSCVFLLCTLMCHLCVAPLRDLHGLCLAAYMGALLVADASLFTIKMYSSSLTDSTCIAVGTITQVSFLSTFMWLNVICIDIWSYVGQTVQAVPLYRTPSDFRWFFVYGVYAWGCPVIFGVVIGGLQSQSDNHNMTLVPDFANNNCWFNASEYWETVLFFYGPIGVLLVVNTIFIVHTGLRLYYLHHPCCFSCFSCFPSYRQDQEPLHRPHLNEFWERFALFAILASCWGTELISWFSGYGDSLIWGLTDTINAFQGVFIFFIFLRSTKKRRLLKQSINKWLNTTREWSSSSWRKVSSTNTKPGHLVNNLRNSVNVPTQRAFNNVIFKEKLSNTSSFENMISEDAEHEDDDLKVSENNCVGQYENQNLGSVWTIPQWRSMKSKSYFPNITNSCHPKEGSFQNNQSFLESFGDLQSIYSSYDQECNSEYQAGNDLSLERNTFANWNLLRTRTGSITLKDEENRRDSGGDVICQGLKQRDPK